LTDDKSFSRSAPDTTERAALRLPQRSVHLPWVSSIAVSWSTRGSQSWPPRKWCRPGRGRCSRRAVAEVQLGVAGASLGDRERIRDQHVAAVAAQHQRALDDRVQELSARELVEVGVLAMKPPQELAGGGELEA
jgi:hypothetical protein